MNNIFSKIMVTVFAVMILTGCNAYKKVIYLQNAGKQAVMNDSVMAPIPEPTLKVGDLLIITVNTATPELSMPFNLPLVPTLGMNYYNPSQSAISTYSGGLQNYLVDTQGNIVLPVLGKMHVLGMTKDALADSIKQQIYPRYLKETPIILIRYANFNVSVLGEVARPNNYLIDNEKVSILDAIAMAGDLTIYGRRDNVLLIRQGAKGRESIRIDLLDKNLINSPYYYLQQDDVLYIQPNNPKSRSSQLSTAETLSVSVVGTLISLTSIIITLVKK
jgi:polysaccharide export outer membrane protein